MVRLFSLVDILFRVGMSEFFDTFNNVLLDMESTFTETWTFNSKDYPAIAIDHEASSTRVMKGGVYQDVTTTIYVRKSVFDSSGVTQDATVTARGQDFAILGIEQEGDECRTLICGPIQIDVWGK